MIFGGSVAQKKKSQKHKSKKHIHIMPPKTPLKLDDPVTLSSDTLKWTQHDIDKYYAYCKEDDRLPLVLKNYGENKKKASNAEIENHITFLQKRLALTKSGLALLIKYGDAAEETSTPRTANRLAGGLTMNSEIWYCIILLFRCIYGLFFLCIFLVFIEQMYILMTGERCFYKMKTLDGKECMTVFSNFFYLCVGYLMHEWQSKLLTFLIAAFAVLKSYA